MNDLVSFLPKSAADSGFKAWTVAVKAVMYELAQRYGAEVPLDFCGTYTKDGVGTREWLLDIVWYDKTEQSESMLLGLESEWLKSVDSVRTDFCKLLAVKAPLKIMLFDASRLPVGDYIKALQDLCRKWQQHSKGDLIYAIDFSRGEHKTYFAEIVESGAQPNFELKKDKDLSGPDDFS